MENKKTKLTISGTPKKSFKNFKEKSLRKKNCCYRIDRKSTNQGNFK